jgi:hypothetical protein
MACLALPARAVVASGEDDAPRTGDVWIDRTLPDIDAYAARYPDSFADEMQRYFGVSPDYVQALLAQPGWRAGDVHFACALAKASAHSCREVVRARAQHYTADWRDVAKGLGVRPGYGEYKRVRAAIRASYAHWARPLPEER